MQLHTGVMNEPAHIPPDAPSVTFSNSAWKGPDAYDHLRQRILNSKSGPGPWPNAVVHRLRVPVPIRVRLVWEKDGVEYIDTVAHDWGGLHVLVDLLDRQHRWPSTGVWLHCDDVGRL
jgi:hypothetical protein